MSKKRLEEIETKYSIISITSKQGGIEYTEVEVEDLEFLIQNGFEQVERVQELERQLKVSNSVHADDRKLLNRRTKQNKRYREALEEILKSDVSTWGFHQIARKALEGEK